MDKRKNGGQDENRKRMEGVSLATGLKKEKNTNKCSIQKTEDGESTISSHWTGMDMRDWRKRTKENQNKLSSLAAPSSQRRKADSQRFPFTVTR